MRILHVLYDDTQNPWCGGGGASRAQQVNQYLAAEHSITVLTGNFPGARDESINGVMYRRIGLRSSYLLSRLSFSLLAPYWVRRIPADLVINDCSYFSPSFANLYCGQPALTIIHHLMGRHAFRLNPITGSFPFLVEKFTLATARHIITPSSQVKNTIQAAYSKKNIRNIANGVTEELFSLVPEEQPFILFLGRMDIYMKGIDTLLEAFTRLEAPGICLKIAGSGKDHDVRRLQELLRKAPLPNRVSYLGRVTEAEKFELLRSCLFVVMPSRFEGWGITATEANAAGKAVVGTAIPGLTEAVEADKTALLVPPEDPERLKKAMAKLLAEPELRWRLGQEGRRHAQQFRWPAIARQQLAFYQEVRTKEIKENEQKPAG